MEVKNKKATNDDFCRWMAENHISVDIITREFMHIAFDCGAEWAMKNESNNNGNESHKENEG